MNIMGVDTEGLKKATIARALGIKRHTFYVWQRQGVLEEKIKAIEKANKLFKELEPYRKMKKEERDRRAKKK